MKSGFCGIRSFSFVLVFSFQTAFTAGLTAQQHAEEVIACGDKYTSATAITSIQLRKDRFFTHIVDQHFGLNPNSYATYNPVESENKELRSEFVLSDVANIGITEVAAIGITEVAARRQEVAAVALHIYLFEIINDHSRLTGVPHEKKTFKDHINTIKNISYNQAFLDGEAPQKIKDQKTQTLQRAIDLLNIRDVWDKLETISATLPGADIAIAAARDGTPAVTYATLNENIAALRGFIADAATGGATPLSNMATSAEKNQVIINIKAQIENLKRLLNKNSPKNFYLAQAIAEETFTYAMGLDGKQGQIAGDLINIHCPVIPPILPNNIVRMVSQTPWYRPPVGAAALGTMTPMAQRPNAGNIMVGFLRYGADGSIDETAYHTGDIDYSTMYPIP